MTGQTGPITDRVAVTDGTIDDLHRHLQAACNLELWTIPLYLTAVSSIKADNSHVELPVSGGSGESCATSTVTRLLISVALQEMYHLQLAGNITRLFGAVPDLAWPDYRQIPNVWPQPDGVAVELGPAVENTLLLMRAVETPGTSTTPIGENDPDVPIQETIQYDAAGDPVYGSIGALYSVVAQLADRFRSYADAGAPQVANGLFSSWYPHSGVLNPATIDEAINVIIDEGEGALGHPRAPIDDPEARPDERGFRDPFFAENKLSHFERFELALDNLDDVELWPIGPAAASAEQANLTSVLAALLDGLRAGWSGGVADIGPMFLARTALAQVFIAGQVPTFDPPTGQRSLTEAMTKLAPEQGATWAENIQWFFGLTDSTAMAANHVEAPRLDNQQSVFSHHDEVVAVTKQQQMPPGELNLWSAEQIASLEGWDGN